MRITAAAKQQTRRRILDAARKLLNSRGYDQTTTRDITREAGIAAGTLFNYFPSKEAIAAALVAEAIEGATRDFEGKRRPDASLEEDLFLLIAAEMRRLKPLRKILRPILDTLGGPFASVPGTDARGVRAEHLDAVAQLLNAHGVAEDPSPVDLQLYWTLYSGVLAHWSCDSSPHQEDTLALLDQSLRMFVGWLRSKHENETSRTVLPEGRHASHRR